MSQLLLLPPLLLLQTSLLSCMATVLVWMIPQLCAVLAA
jgi:hypothetical protein